MTQSRNNSLLIILTCQFISMHTYNKYIPMFSLQYSNQISHSRTDWRSSVSPLHENLTAAIPTPSRIKLHST